MVKIMKEITDINFKENFFSTLNKVRNSYTPILIVKKHDKLENNESLVLMSFKGYQAIETLLEVMENPFQYAQLLKELDIQPK